MRSILTFSLIVLALFLRIDSAFGLSLRISQSPLGEPFYRSISKLRFISDSAETGIVAVKFFGKRGEVIELLDKLKIKKSDYSCSNETCFLDFYDLPISLEKYTCSIEVKFTNSLGQTLLETRTEWGNCVEMSNLPDLKFRPDFLVPDDSFFSDSGSFELLNVGASALQKSLLIWGVLFDSAGKVIWKSQYRNVETFVSQERKALQFGTRLKNWQIHLSCGGFLVVDPDFEISERSKLNNKFNFDFGLCETIPSEQNGDRIDLIPLAEIKNSHLFLRAQNIGRLSYVDHTNKLETYIRYLDADGRVIFQKSPFTEPEIHGFGDEKSIIVDPIPAGTCTLEIELNPNIRIKESNYLNNRIQMNLCE